MTVQLLEIPDDAGQLPRWLEGHLLGCDLADLVAQLDAVHGAQLDRSPTLDELLAGNRDAVLRSGLSALSPEQLHQLLVHPHLLVDLQEALLLEGGPYWTRQAQGSTQLQNDLNCGRRRMARFLATQTEEPSAAPAANSMQPRSAWSWRDVLVGLATAAAVLIAVTLHQRAVPGPAGGESTAVAWGWAKPGALPEKATRDEYLKTLADEAKQWFNKKPEDPSGLAQRIVQFRQGCSVLMLAPHPALPPADRQWLIAKCKAWAAKLDEQLTALESGADPQMVREATDGIVNKLIDALKTQASTPAATV